MGKKKVLIVYYSFSSQTQLLVQRLASGLQEYDVEVKIERLLPMVPLPFPFPSFIQLMSVMIRSFFRQRVAIQPMSHKLQKNWDLIILGGPTWSYNPSGPMLSFLDGPGMEICRQQAVMPLISCRSYWRTHYITIKRMLTEMEAKVESPLVYKHGSCEPWRTVGLFLQNLGRLPRLENSWFRKVYPRYGHEKAHYEHIQARGREIAKELLADD